MSVDSFHYVLRNVTQTFWNTMSQNIPCPGGAGWIKMQIILAASFDVMQLIVEGEYAMKVVRQFLINELVPESKALDIKYILNFQQMQSFE